jgi:hypothetical protein
MMPNTDTWVVYEKYVFRKAAGQNAVCEQGEWDEMERAQPGCQNVIKAGIATEQEAERYARNGPGLGITSAVPHVKKLAMYHGGWRPARQEP